MAGRPPPAPLDDVATVLDVVRTWAGVVEKRAGVLYVRQLPFLHFHLGPDGRRRADIKGRAGWPSIELPRPLSARGRHALLGALRRGYVSRVAAKSSGRSGRKMRSKASQRSFE